MEPNPPDSEEGEKVERDIELGTDIQLAKPIHQPSSNPNSARALSSVEKLRG